MQAEEQVDADTISRVMSQIGRKKTEKKTASAVANLAAGRERLQDADVRALLSEKQQARRERERQEREAAAAAAGPVEKKQAGRPRTHPLVEAGEKRGRGRPKKQDGQTAAQSAGTPQSGTGEAGQA